MLTLSQLRQLSETKVKAADRADIRQCAIDASLPERERMERLAEQLGNPYCFRWGGVSVNLRFSGEGPDIRDAVEEYLRRLSEGDLC